MATLRILGNASAAPPANGACSAYLVEARETRLLLDCGPGSLANIRAATNVNDLDGVIISHMHTDHFLDLLAMNVALRTEERQRAVSGAPWRLPLFLPPGGLRTLEACFAGLATNVTGTTATRWRESFDAREYEPDETLVFGPMSVTFVGPTKHSQLDYGLRLACDGAVLGYTGDTAYCEAAVEVGRDADLFLAECTLMEAGPASETHTCAAELATMAMAARPGRLLATHFLRHDEPWQSELRSRLSREAENIESHVVRLGDVYEF